MPRTSLDTFGCAYCATAASFKGDVCRMPKTCPTLTQPEVSKDAAPYKTPENAETMRVADATPFTDDGRLRNRVEELVHFAKGRGMTKVGVAFCVSLTKEAQALGRMLEAEGLEAALVCCRVGAIDYDEIGLSKKHPERFAAICNPVAQARLLNEKKVDLVAQLGLCIGHDLLLQEASDAPVTTLVVKDRALDHHPIEALRTAARPSHATHTSQSSDPSEPSNPSQASRRSE
jgi:uncharacterized metal-binding protein